MAILQNLAYRIERIFNGESGIVEKVDSISEDKITDRDNYIKDYFGNLPKLITFRNNLGQLVTKYTPKKLIYVSQADLYSGGSIDTFTRIDVHKTYKPGDKFP